MSRGDRDKARGGHETRIKGHESKLGGGEKIKDDEVDLGLPKVELCNRERNYIK